jgi:hypothetical protein
VHCKHSTDKDSTATTEHDSALNMILPKKVGSRFQMDLIEMPFSQGYRLRVVDQMSCIGYVAPIKLKEGEEISTQVVKIITTSVALQILQFDNGHEVSLLLFMC